MRLSDQRSHLAGQVLEVHPVRQLDRRDTQPQPPGVIHHPFAVNSPTGRLAWALLDTHACDATGAVARAVSRRLNCPVSERHARISDVAELRHSIATLTLPGT